MKKITLLLVLIFIVVGIQWGAGPEEKAINDPVKNFEFLWKTFDRNYALFGAKRVDWDALYRLYRPQVTPETTNDQLFTIMSNMLGHLNDNHVRLIDGKKRFTAGILHNRKMEDFSLELVKSKYLKGKFKKEVRAIFTYGKVKDTIGYFHFRGFGFLEQTRETIDKIIKEFKDADGIIIDVRSNGGGDDRVGKLIADRFADRKRLYMITQIRNGKNHDDFTPPRYWYVEPDGPAQFTKPVILLTHRFSASAADNFAMALRVIPHVTVVGEMTSGCMADVYGDQLPNGWRFSVSFKKFTDYSGFCWEGIGIPTDLRKTNTKADIDNKTDTVLELAVKLIEGGKLKPQEEPGSLEDIRESLAKNLEQDIEKHGLKNAIKAFHKAKSRDPRTYYIDREELDMLANRLSGAGKKMEALEVHKINAKVHPQKWEVYRNLAKAYAEQGNKKLTAENFQKAIDQNPRTFPWEKGANHFMAMEKTMLEKGLEAAVKQCRATWKNHKDELTEQGVNRFGYELLGNEKMEAAIAVFKLNTELYPNAWNTYDSLGEAYMKAGKKEAAIKNYKKSLELNQENNNAKEMLKNLEEK
jgi:tetratricopeptide (TPR) repeat protein